MSSLSSVSRDDVGTAEAAPLYTRPSLRAVLLSLGLAAIFGVINPINDYRFGNTYIGACHLPPGAVGALIVLLAFQTLIFLAGRISRKWALSRNEVLTVYLTALFSALVPGRAGENFFVPCLVGPFYYSTAENKWLDFLLPNLKPWFTPALNADGSVNQTLVQSWYQGLNQGQSIPWASWLVPLLAWTLLIGALYCMLACLAVLLRAQWVEHEALSFPLLRLPMELTEGTDEKKVAPILRDGALWIGVGIAVVARSMSSLKLYFPDVPDFPLSLNTGPLLTEAPWNQMGPFPVTIVPMAVGITFLLASEVALSFWFFFLLHKLEMVLAYSVGFPPSTLPDPAWTRGWAEAFISFQNIGAYFGFACILLYTGRHHYGYILRRAVGKAPARAGEAAEALPYPLAFWGMVASSLVLVGWAAAAGMRPEIALIFWLTYIVMALGLSRAVVEGGLLYVNHGWSPLGPLAALTGGSGPGHWMGPATIVPGSILQGALVVDMKSFLLPSFLHAFKLAHERRMAMRPLLGLIMAAIAVAYGLSVWSNVRLGYVHNGLEMHPWFARQGPQDAAINAASLMRGTDVNPWLNWFWFGVGAASVTLLTVLRSLYSWFPLHPLGLIMWSPFVMQNLWFSIFLGWLCKALLMRFGGIPAYQRALPAFLGLALGDVSMMLFWAAIDASQGQMLHGMMPG